MFQELITVYDESRPKEIRVLVNEMVLGGRGVKV